jgi:hypothetical protein
MLMLTVKLVSLLRVTELTVIPDPRLTVDCAVNCVFVPAIVSDKVCPCSAFDGVTLRIAGGAVTVKAFACVTSVRPFTWTDRGPTEAPALIVMVATALPFG